MKLINEVYSFKNLKLAYKKVMSGNSKHSTDAVKFKMFWYRNLKMIQEELIKGCYEFGEYTTFTVYEPKKRDIDAPCFRDKIVHHAINNILRDFYEKRFHSNSFACIRNKGNQRAVKKLHQIVRKITKNNKTVYFIKIDIFKFFPSIKKDILLRIIERKIKCIGLIKLIKNFLVSYIKTGLPLGAVISQLFANIYLDVVDYFASKILSVKNYLRYADDIFIINNSLENARQIKTTLVHFIYRTLYLEVGRGKSYIRNAKHGISGLGHTTYHNKIAILYKSFKKIKRYNENIINTRKETQSHNSRLGVFKNSSYYQNNVKSC